MKNKAVWTKLLFITLIIFLVMNISSALHAAAVVDGSVEFGASGSEAGTEKFDTKLNLKIRKDKFGADFSHEFSKEQDGKELKQLSTATAIQGNYFLFPKQFIYLNFKCSRDIEEKEDISEFGAGYGYRTDMFSIQTGLLISTAYYGVLADRRFLSDTAMEAKVPLDKDKVFWFAGDAGLNFVLDDVEDYELVVEPGLIANFVDNIGLKATYRYEANGKGDDNAGSWLLRLVAGF